MCVCVCVCACVRACVHVRARTSGCVCVRQIACAHGWIRHGPRARLERRRAAHLARSCRCRLGARRAARGAGSGRPLAVGACPGWPRPMSRPMSRLGQICPALQSRQPAPGSRRPRLGPASPGQAGGLATLSARAYRQSPRGGTSGISESQALSSQSSPGPAGGAPGGYGPGRGAAGPGRRCMAAAAGSRFRTDPSTCPLMLRHRHR